MKTPLPKGAPIFERNELLETLSNKIRYGEPVGFLEAIACIEYQAQRNYAKRQNIWWRRLARYVRHMVVRDDRAGGWPT